ncbi:MAG: VWA domain-containing protein [Kiritimatiellae bacterium]|nr:VWA domain-containing protein [Kiritimatiellia bacterium]
MLIAAWLIVPLAWLLFKLRRRTEKKLERLIHPEALPLLAPGYNRRRARTRNLLWLGAVLLALLALARPQWGFHWDEVRRRGLDVMVVLDTSKSMLAEDIKPDRLQQAKWGVRDLLQKLRGDRVGLIPFAGSAFLQCPLTMDYPAFLMSLDDVYAGIIPRGGTAIGKAIEKAVESFEYDRSNADKVILLITDGEDHEGNPTRLIPELQKRGIRVFAIGVGTIEGDLIPTQEPQGGTGFIKDAEGRVIKSALTEGSLQQLAMETGGIYVRSAPGDFGMERIYDRGIDQLQRDERESRMMKIYEERYVWFLLVAFLLLVVEGAVSQGLPIRKIPAIRMLPIILLASLCLGSPCLAGESARSYMNEGLRNYQNAESIQNTLADKNVQDVQQDEDVKNRILEMASLYESASSNFLQASESARANKKLDPSEPLSNAGAASFRLQDYAQAESAWKSALQTRDLNLQSRLYHNLGVLSTATLMTNQTADFETIMNALNSSLENYEKAILLNTEQEDSKINYELTLRQKEMLLAAREYLRQIMMQAKNLVRQGRFDEAAQLLQKYQQEPNTQQALSLDTTSQKDSSDLSTKITEILGVDEEAKQMMTQLRQHQQKAESLTPSTEAKP